VRDERGRRRRSSNPGSRLASDWSIRGNRRPLSQLFRERGDLRRRRDPKLLLEQSLVN
jgi:hypothetical protein